MSQNELDTIQQPLPLGDIWRGIVSHPPINQTARMGITCPDMHPDLYFPKARWLARGHAMPKVNDEVLVIFDNYREPWVIGWWPAVKLPEIMSGLVGDGPPVDPVDDDIWIATNVDVGVRWAFQYEAGSGSPYKWEFIGGAAFYGHGIPLTLPRAGDYQIRWSADGTVASGNTWSDALSASSGTLVGGSGGSLVSVSGGTTSIASIRSRLAGTAQLTGAAINTVVQHNVAGATANSTELAITPVRVS